MMTLVRRKKRLETLLVLVTLGAQVVVPTALLTAMLAVMLGVPLLRLRLRLLLLQLKRLGGVAPQAAVGRLLTPSILHNVSDIARRDDSCALLCDGSVSVYDSHMVTAQSLGGFQFPKLSHTIIMLRGR